MIIIIYANWLDISYTAIPLVHINVDTTYVIYYG